MEPVPLQDMMVTSDDRPYREWKFDRRASQWMFVMSLLLFFVGVQLFSILAFRIFPIYTIPNFAIRPEQVGISIAIVISVMLGVTLFSIGILVFHEFCHWLAFRWAGITATYGAKIIHKILPVLYVTAPDSRVTREQFIVILLAPTVIVNALGISLMAFPTLLRYAMVLPMALHFGGCIGDWWMTVIVARAPGKAIIEDTEEGFRYRVGPVGHEA